jgi:predicted GNAT superfamily acetyltransferase
MSEAPDEFPMIRRAESLADYRACQEAQRRAWGLVEENYVVPVATLVGANLHGGLVLGAFKADGSAAGLSFGFLGKIDGRIGLYSQLTGVVPEFQSRGLGYRLKQEQFDFARREGLPFVAWTFDPLQFRNARFNLDKLGATVRHYIDDMYGSRSDSLNVGATTDRVLAVWEASAGTKSHVTDADSLPRIVATGRTIEDPPECRSLAMIDFASMLVVEFPASILELRAGHPIAAERWRLAVRAALSDTFSAGYRAIGTWTSGEQDEPRRVGYILASQRLPIP